MNALLYEPSSLAANDRYKYSLLQDKMHPSENNLIYPHRFHLYNSISINITTLFMHFMVLSPQLML